MRARVIVTAGLAVVWMASCSNLPDIKPDVCGNAIVEGAEDCDSFGDPSTPGSVCIPSGQADECHFECDPSGADPKCPAGYFCSASGVCRAPTGTFDTTVGKVGSSGAYRVLAADFDGDYASDVVTVGPAREIHFFDGRTEAAQLPIATGELPVLGKVGDSSAPRASAVVISHFLTPGSNAPSGNLRVWRGAPDRTLLPTVYPGLDLNATAPALTAGRVLPTFRFGDVGSDIFALINPAGGSSGAFDLVYVNGTKDAQSQQMPKPLFSGLDSPDGPTGIAGDIPSAIFGDVSTCPSALTHCDAFVLAYQGQSTVGLYPTCDAAGNNPGDVQNFVPAAPTILTLPDTVSGRAFVAKHPNAALPSLFVVGTNGLWEFPGIPCGVSSAPMKRAEVPANTSVLAVGFFDQTDNGDCLDWVGPDGLHVWFHGNPASSVCDAAPEAQASDPIQEAFIGDFNGNGAPDVVALSTTSFDFYNGSGGLLPNPQHTVLTGTGRHLVVGDFDGDFIPDFAFDVEGDSTDDIQMAFGEPAGFPLAPVSVGGSAQIAQLAPLDYDYRLNGTPDLISTLFAIGKNPVDKHLVISMLEGNPERLVDSPFFLDPATNMGIASAVVGSFGGDTAGESGLAGLGYGPALGLWFAPATGDAQLDVTKSVVATPDASVGLSILTLGEADIAALDVGGAPGDELVVLSPESDDGKTPSCFSAWSLVADQSGNYSWVGPQTCEKPTGVRGVPSIIPSIPKRVRLAVADLDGDGKKDLIASYGDANGAFTARVVFNDGAGSLSFASGTVLTLPSDTVAVAAIHFRQGTASQLLALAKTGLYVADVNGRSIGTFEPAPFAQGASESLPEGVLTDLVVGDVDGDGIDDAVVASSSHVFVFYGFPRPLQ